MEWDMNAWEIEIPNSSAISSNENGDYSFSGLLDSSSKDRGGLSDMMEEASVLSGEAMIGLKLGRQTICCQEKSSCSPIVKRSRASYATSSHLPARCQVEGCNLNLSSAKDYHRRHRICSDHSKSPKVVVAGKERRFCQQCSRLHDLSEFDDWKRSCRRRLSAHNARRRRPPTEDIKFSSKYIRRPHMGFLVNQISNTSRNATPQSSSNLNRGCVEMMSSVSLSDISSSLREVTPKSGLEANSSFIYAMEVQRQSISLETTSSWGFDGHDEPSSFDHFIHGDNIGLTQPGVPLGSQSTCNTQLSPQDFICFSSD